MNRTGLALTIIFLCFISLSCANTEAPQEEVKGFPVTVIKPEVRDIVVYYDTSSTIEAADVRTLSFTVPGKIAEMYKDDGERISKGEIIAELDRESYLNGLKAAESNLALALKRNNAAKVQKQIHQNQLKDAENMLADTEKDFNRYKRLRDEKVITQKEFEGMETRYKSMKLAVDNAKSALKLAQVQIATTQDAVDAATAQRDVAKKQYDDTVIHAPFDGTISKKMTDTSSVPKPGEPVYEVVADGDLKIEASLPERYINSVSEGSNLLLTVPNNHYVNNLQKVTMVHREVSAQTGNFGVTIDLKDVNGALRHGMFAHLSFEIDRSANTISLPVEAIIELAGEKIVYIAKNNKSVKTIVKTGLVTKDHIEILSGLSKDDNVVLSGNKYVVDDTDIRIIEHKSENSSSETSEKGE
ncbi:efflux RND transporter periplasmic adaptor subunit [bacterium]|nr:efflux RND transporter periplasmic adaptor subunit [bacterium]